MTRQPPPAKEIITRLKALADPGVKTSQERFGIQGGQRLGISLYTLRDMVKGIRDHDLALALWQCGIHEARMLAAMIEEPAKVTVDQAEHWVAQFDS